MPAILFEEMPVAAPILVAHASALASAYASARWRSRAESPWIFGCPRPKHETRNTEYDSSRVPLWARIAGPQRPKRRHAPQRPKAPPTLLRYKTCRMPYGAEYLEDYAPPNAIAADTDR